MPDKALLLGINDYKKINPLRGCINDVENMRHLLVQVYGFNQANIKSLLNEKVVKSEVRKQMKWLFKDARPNDRVVLHYSGHGSFTTDVDGDEDDGADELICLYDMDFNDPGTYLLDDELRSWAEGLPAGVQLTIVLDSCHSGTGTRVFMAPLPGRGQHLVPMRVDDKLTMSRAIEAAATHVRGLDLAVAVSDSLEPTNDNLVRIRFVDPPPAIREAVATRGTKRSRGQVVVKMNHILLAACRHDQTAADAVLDGVPNGAFTFHLCKTIREGGAKLDRKALIRSVESGLATGHFVQEPQLEGPDERGPLFATSQIAGGDGNSPPAAPSPTPAVVASHTLEAWRVAPGELRSLIDSIARLAPEAQVEIARSLRPRLETTYRGGNEARAAGRYLVYVHGICQHLVRYSDERWATLRPHTSAFGDGRLGDTRREVLWSDLVNERAIALQAARAVDSHAAREADEQQRLKAEIEEVMRDRADRQVVDTAEVEGERAIAATRELSIPGLNCLDDFTVYMINERTRRQVIERFTSVVRPLLESGAEVDILSHSWGTVVAYEGLRQLEDEGLGGRSVRNLFTVGAALSIGPVKMRLRPANRNGRRPAMVRRWVNLNARGDIVGGPLQGRPYQVDHDFPNLEPVGCRVFLGFVNPQCAHGSYFVAGNLAVNRDIFGRYVNQA